MFVPLMEASIVENWERMPSRFGCVYPHSLHHWELVTSEEMGFIAICVNNGCENIYWYGRNFQAWKNVWLNSKVAKEFTDETTIG